MQVMVKSSQTALGCHPQRQSRDRDLGSNSSLMGGLQGEESEGRWGKEPSKGVTTLSLALACSCLLLEISGWPSVALH